MRLSAMESLAETKKRKGDGEAGKRKRKMSYGSDTIAFLQQRYQVDSELTREELKLKQEEMNERKAQQDSFIAQQAALTNTLNETIPAQQRQQEQLIHHMLAQNAALITLTQKIAN